MFYYLDMQLTESLTFILYFPVFICLQMELTKTFVYIHCMPKCLAICCLPNKMKGKRKLSYDDKAKFNETTHADACNVNAVSNNIEAISVIPPDNVKRKCKRNNYRQNSVESKKNVTQYSNESLTQTSNSNNVSNDTDLESYAHQQENLNFRNLYTHYRNHPHSASPLPYTLNKPQVPEKTNNPYEARKKKGVFFRPLMPNEKKSSIYFTTSANAKTPPTNGVQGLTTKNYQSECEGTNSTQVGKQMQILGSPCIETDCNIPSNSLHRSITVNKSDDINQSTSIQNKKCYMHTPYNNKTMCQQQETTGKNNNNNQQLPSHDHNDTYKCSKATIIDTDQTSMSIGENKNQYLTRNRNRVWKM